MSETKGGALKMVTQGASWTVITSNGHDGSVIYLCTRTLRFISTTSDNIEFSNCALGNPAFNSVNNVFCQPLTIFGIQLK